MGLDQFAKAVRGEMTIIGEGYDSYEKYEFEYSLSDWRKHPNLQGWMQNLWESRGKKPDNERCEYVGCVKMTDGQFNGVEVELSLADLDLLEADIIHADLPRTSGFFFGENSDERYKEQDLEFVQDARVAIADGYTVIYDSSW